MINVKVRVVIIPGAGQVRVGGGVRMRSPMGKGYTQEKAPEADHVLVLDLSGGCFIINYTYTQLRYFSEWA